jgi:hypothetical protein
MFWFMDLVSDEIRAKMNIIMFILVEIRYINHGLSTEILIPSHLGSRFGSYWQEFTVYDQGFLKTE